MSYLKPPGEGFGGADQAIRSGQVSVHRERMFALGDPFRGTVGVDIDTA